MPKSITLSSGSILAGSPITLAITPTPVSGKNISFHRIICEVKAGISGGEYEVIPMSRSITSNATQQIDISSALRVLLEQFTYTHSPQQYPFVQWQVRVYDEYMQDGVLRTPIDEQYFPSKTTYYRAVAGKFTDLERIHAAHEGQSTLPVQSLTRKPSSSPQIVKVGETFVYAPPYESPQLLPVSSDLASPESKEVTIAKEGTQQLGYQRIYALPANDPSHRTQFRFINSYGVMESLSLPDSYEQGVSVTSTESTVATVETFSQFSHAIIRKRNDREQWKYATDPLDRAWHQWFIHEFLMASHVWAFIEGTWLRCHIHVEDDTVIHNSTKSDYHVVQFTVKFDITGSPVSY